MIWDSGAVSGRELDLRTPHTYRTQEGQYPKEIRKIIHPLAKEDFLFLFQLMQEVRDMKTPNPGVNFRWSWDLNLHCQQFLRTEPRKWHRNWSSGTLEKSKCKTTLKESFHNISHTDFSQKKRASCYRLLYCFHFFIPSYTSPTHLCNVTLQFLPLEVNEFLHLIDVGFDHVVCFGQWIIKGHESS